MSEYVLPNADNAPPASREFRVGMSFRVGGGGSLADVIRVLSPAEGKALSGASTSGRTKSLTADWTHDCATVSSL